jgi:hypothetical protein
MLEPLTVPCQECDREPAADSPELRLELTCDDEPLTYCEASWEREFGENEEDPVRSTFDRRARGAALTADKGDCSELVPGTIRSSRSSSILSVGSDAKECEGSV